MKYKGPIEDLIEDLRECVTLGGGWGDVSKDDLESLIAAIPQWQPIDTAPLMEPSDLIVGQKNYRFVCLLQEHDGSVSYGWGYYINPPFRDTDRACGQWGQFGLRWRNTKEAHITPKYWMPLPAPKVEA